jgi:hypothetical protein
MKRYWHRYEFVGLWVSLAFFIIYPLILSVILVNCDVPPLDAKVWLAVIGFISISLFVFILVRFTNKAGFSLKRYEALLAANDPFLQNARVLGWCGPILVIGILVTNSPGLSNVASLCMKSGTAFIQ